MAISSTVTRMELTTIMEHPNELKVVRQPILALLPFI